MSARLNAEVVNEVIKKIAPDSSVRCLEYVAGGNAKSQFFCGEHFFEAAFYSVKSALKKGSSGCRYCKTLSLDDVNTEINRINPDCTVQCLEYVTGEGAKSRFFCGEHFFEARFCHVRSALNNGFNGCVYCRGVSSLDDVNAQIRKIDPDSSVRCVEYVVGEGAKSAFQCADHNIFNARWSSVKNSIKRGLTGCPQCPQKSGYDRSKSTGSVYCYMILLEINSNIYICSKYGITNNPNSYGTRMSKKFHDTYAPVAYTNTCTQDGDETGAEIAFQDERMVHKYFSRFRLPIIESDILYQHGPSEIFLGTLLDIEAPSFFGVKIITPDNQQELSEFINTMPKSRIEQSLLQSSLILQAA